MASQVLEVIVVGAGIGGLTAAIALRREGHRVRVYEKASLLHEIGQGITISPNGGRILRDLGMDFERAKIGDLIGTNVVNAETLENLTPAHDFSDVHKDFGVRLKTAYRVDLHAALVDLACTKEAQGEAVQIYTKKGVSDFDCLNGIVVLESGEEVRGDFVIAADGVRSQAAEHINGADCPAIESSGTIVYRFTIPSDKLRADPDTASLLTAGDGFCSFNVHPAGKKWLVRYYARNAEISNFALYSLRELNSTALQEHELRYKTNTIGLQREMEGFHPTLLKAAGMANDVLPLWRCTTREPLDTLHKGRMVVIGDAAHPVFPHMGLGAVSAIEDAAFLGRLFHNLPVHADTVTAIEQRLELFSKYRKPRVAAYKYYSDVPFFKAAVDEQREKVTRFMSPEHLPVSQEQLRPWYMSYNAVQDAAQALRVAGLEDAIHPTNGVHA